MKKVFVLIFVLLLILTAACSQPEIPKPEQISEPAQVTTQPQETESTQ